MVRIPLEEIATLLQQREFAQAESLSKKLLQEFPTDADLRRKIALLASQTGQHKLALDCMAQAAALAPKSLEYRFQLGCLLAHAGRYAQSLREFEETVLGWPDFANGWYFKGIALLRLGRDHEALPALRRAHSLALEDAKILRALASLEFRIGYPADALPLWEQLHQLQPDDIETILKKGETLSRLGSLDQAISTYSDGIRYTPDSPDLWMALAQAHDDNGNRIAAAEAFSKALQLRPDWPFPMAGLLGLHRDHAPESVVERAKFLLASSSITDHDRSLLGYELGKVLDTRGEYAEAMARWNDANSARIRMTGSFDPARLDRKANRIIETYTVESFSRPFADEPSDELRFVFIVGMPRSGTTLTEQIIAAHPSAFGCGELPDIALISRELALEAVRQGNRGVHDYTPTQIAGAIRKYISAATRHAPAVATRLADKAPLNFWDLDLIARMFPQARVIWCRRDPRDIAISIYGENFALDERYATDLTWILHYVETQRRIMRHWQDVLPIAIHELHYEQLATSFESEARKLIDFIGLPWDSACFRFHLNNEGVQSPSRWQVKQPVHTRSVGRWRNYENLQDVFSHQLMESSPTN
ncbi:hypothetical protein CSC73_01065 [Pseudoxanthomonas sacheonensis]|nr:hypothetical protein CSC73_01065 [Pseudoxanthomonas sacheonensis]